MDYARTSQALNTEASLAAGQQIEKLEALLANLESSGGRALTDPEIRAGIVRISRALGISPFELQFKEVPNEERRARVSVAIVEEFRDLQAQNGGSLPVSHLAKRVSKALSSRVTVDETLLAMTDLSMLGSGLRLETLPNGTKVVRSAAEELSSDQGSVLAACDALGYVTSDLLQDNFNWEHSRAVSVLDAMVTTGLLWVDLQCHPAQYWAPSAI